MATEIKECPFCGKQPELIRRGNEHTKRSAEIICKNCGVIIKVAAIRNNLQWCVDTVIAKWNKRQPPPVEVEQAAAIKFPIDDSMPEGMKYNQGSKREGFIEGFKASGQWEEFALGLLNFMHNKGIEIDYTLDTPAIFGEEEGFLSFEELINTFKAAQTK